MVYEAPRRLHQELGDLEKLFLTCFFEDDSEITMPTLLVMKQQKGESVKVFVERFQNMAL